MTFQLTKGERIAQRQLLADLVALQYKRNDQAFQRGTFRVRGDTVEVFPAHLDDRAWRLSFFGDEIEEIVEFDPLTGHKSAILESVKSTPTRTTSRPSRRSPGREAHQGRPQRAPRTVPRRRQAARSPAAGAAHPVRHRDDGGHRLVRRHRELLALPHRPRARRAAADPVRIPARQRLVFIDESHVTVPQIGGMFRGDFNRKATLAEFGFRLPSASTTARLRFEEWEAMRPQTIHVSATPGAWEMERPAASSPNRSSAPPA
jgi:excinuclease ABC subunit B